MQIRPFAQADREQVVQIALEVFEPVSIDAAIEARFGELRATTWRDRKRRDIERDLDRNPQGCFVAEDGGGPVGFVTTAVDETAGVGHVANLGVSAAHQGRKIGKALLSHALDYFEALGLEHAQIETTTTNERGMIFYPSMGYQEVARKIYYAMRLSDRKDR